jgi:hypothetical protein
MLKFVLQLLINIERRRRREPTLPILFPRYILT